MTEARSVNPSQQWVMSGRAEESGSSGSTILFWSSEQCPTQVWKDARLAGINEQHSCDSAYITRAHLHKKWIWNMSKSRDANGLGRQNCNLLELNFLFRRPFHDKKSLMKCRCTVPPIFLLNSVWDLKTRSAEFWEKFPETWKLGCLQKWCFGWYSACASMSSPSVCCCARVTQ